MEVYCQVVEGSIDYHQRDLGTHHQGDADTHDQVTGDKVQDPLPELRWQAGKGVHEEVKYHTEEYREDDRDYIS